MSYCRFNEFNSDVYIFGSGQQLECYVANRAAHFTMVRETFCVPYAEPGVAQKIMLGHIRYLQYVGLRVPEYAIIRLIKEVEKAEDEINQ